MAVEANVDYGRLPFEEAIAYLAGKTNRDTKTWRDIAAAEHDAAFVVAGAKGALLADLRRAVDGAIRDGESLGQFRQRFGAIVDAYGWNHAGDRDWRARTIYNTNLRSAYAAGRYAQQTDPEVQRLQPYGQWVHGDSVRARPHHVALNGRVFSLDDPFWLTNYPPNGFGCFPAGTQVSTATGWRPIESVRAGELVQGGSGRLQPVAQSQTRLYRGDLVWIDADNGRCAATPDHRFLTLRGWVQAGNLKPGDVLVQIPEVAFVDEAIDDVDGLNPLAHNRAVPSPVNDSGVGHALDRQAFFRQVQIDPIGRDVMVVSHLVAQFQEVLLHQGFAARGLGFGVEMQQWVGAQGFEAVFDCFLPHLRAVEGGGGFEPLGHGSNPLARFLGFPLAGMDASGFLLSDQGAHDLAGLLATLGVSFPLEAHRVAAAAAHLEVLNQAQDGAGVHLPAIAELPDGEFLLDIEEPEGFASGQPLDRFDSLESFRAWAGLHGVLSVVVAVGREPYIGNVYNLTVANDSSYLLKLGVVHNCKCRVRTLSQRGLERLGKTEPDVPPTDGELGITELDGKKVAVRWGPDEGFGYAPGASRSAQIRQQVLKNLPLEIQTQVLLESAGAPLPSPNDPPPDRLFASIKELRNQPGGLDSVLIGSTSYGELVRTKGQAAADEALDALVAKINRIERNRALKKEQQEAERLAQEAERLAQEQSRQAAKAKRDALLRERRAQLLNRYELLLKNRGGVSVRSYAQNYRAAYPYVRPRLDALGDRVLSSIPPRNTAKGYISRPYKRWFEDYHRSLGLMDRDQVARPELIDPDFTRTLEGFAARMPVKALKAEFRTNAESYLDAAAILGLTENEGPKTLEASGVRPWADKKDRSLNVGYFSADFLMWHEAAHFAEFATGDFASRQFILDKADSTTLFPLMMLTGDPGYRWTEVALVDNFIDYYVGRWYEQEGTEVISKGFEEFVSPSTMRKLYEKDPEHFRLMAGFLEQRRLDSQARSTQRQNSEQVLLESGQLPDSNAIGTAGTPQRVAAPTGKYQEWLTAGKGATAELSRDWQAYEAIHEEYQQARQRQKDLLAEQLDLESRPMGEAENAKWDAVLAARKALQTRVRELEPLVETAKVEAMTRFRESLLRDRANAEALAATIQIDPMLKNYEAELRSRAADYFQIAGPRGLETLKQLTVAEGGRASADPFGKVVKLSGANPTRMQTLFHEFAHHLEFSDPRIAQEAMRWVEARSNGQGLRRLSEILDDPAYKDYEVAYEDAWVTPYIGKDYANTRFGRRGSEVISVGLEHFSSPARMAALYAKDPEHFELIVGLLAEDAPARKPSAAMPKAKPTPEPAPTTKPAPKPEPTPAPKPPTTVADLKKLTVPQLRKLAAEQGLRLPSKAKKQDLVDALSGGGANPTPTPAPTPAPKPTPEPAPAPKPPTTAADLKKLTVPQLRKLAAEQGLRLPSKAKKQDLVDALSGGANPAPMPVPVPSPTPASVPTPAPTPKPTPEPPPAPKPVAAADLKKLTVPQLRKLAAEQGLRLPSKAKKQDLVDALSGGGANPAPTPAPTPAPKPTPEPAPAPKPPTTAADLKKLTVPQLRKLAAEQGLRLPSKAKKQDLVDALSGGGAKPAPTPVSVPTPAPKPAPKPEPAPKVSPPPISDAAKSALIFGKVSERLGVSKAEAIAVLKALGPVKLKQVLDRARGAIDPADPRYWEKVSEQVAESVQKPAPAPKPSPKPAPAPTPTPAPKPTPPVAKPATKPDPTKATEAAPIKTLPEFDRAFQSEILAEFDLVNGSSEALAIGDLRKRFAGRLSDDEFDDYLRELEDRGIIQLSRDERYPSQGAIKSSFGDWTALRINDKAIDKSIEPAAPKGPDPITTQKHFEQEIDKAIRQVQEEFVSVGNDLIPIYLVRRALGDRVTRSGFSQMLLEMQAQGVVQLEKGNPSEASKDQVRDSVETRTSWLRFYIRPL